jgi:hypothetical protein
MLGSLGLTPEENDREFNTLFSAAWSTQDIVAKWRYIRRMRQLNDQLETLP